MDIYSGNISAYVDVVNISWLASHCNPSLVLFDRQRPSKGGTSMSRTIRSYPRRSLVVTGLALIAVAASAATLSTRSSRHKAALLSPISATSHLVAPRTPSPSTLDGDRAQGAYFAEFTGVGAEGRDMVWRGAVAGVAVGELTILLAHVGRDIDTSEPTWPVEGIIFVSGEDPQGAFAAEVHGTIDWLTKRLTLAGDVSLGSRRGSHVEQTAQLIGHDLSGELRFTPATLADAR
jgi:hypothetical protein